MATGSRDNGLLCFSQLGGDEDENETATVCDTANKKNQTRQLLFEQIEQFLK